MSIYHSMIFDLKNFTVFLATFRYSFISVSSPKQVHIHYLKVKPSELAGLIWYTDYQTKIRDFNLKALKRFHCSRICSFWRLKATQVSSQNKSAPSLYSIHNLLLRFGFSLSLGDNGGITVAQWRAACYSSISSCSASWIGSGVSRFRFVFPFPVILFVHKRIQTDLGMNIMFVNSWRVCENLEIKWSTIW